MSAALVENGIIKYTEKEIYRYGIELLMLKGIALISAVIISSLLGTLTSLFWLLAFFLPIRKYGGGIHASNPITCLVVSEMLLILCQEIIINISFIPHIGVPVYVVSGLLVVVLSPIESKNKLLTTKQKNKYKRYIVVICITTAFLFGILLIERNDFILKSIVTAYVLQAFLLLASFVNNKYAQTE